MNLFFFPDILLHFHAALIFLSIILTFVRKILLTFFTPSSCLFLKKLSETYLNHTLGWKNLKVKVINSHILAQNYSEATVFWFFLKQGAPVPEVPPFGWCCLTLCGWPVQPLSCEPGSCPWAVRPPPPSSPLLLASLSGATRFPTVSSTVRVRVSGLLVKFTVYVYTVEMEGQRHLPSSCCYHRLHGSGHVLLPTDTHFFPLHHWDMVFFDA